MSDDRARQRGSDFLDAWAGKIHSLDGDEWLQPQRLGSKIEPQPYPLEALPPTLREAVREVAQFVKAPVALVAASALSALSVATQALIDVQRADKLRGPTSLYLLTIADSGERKSTCDSFFTRAIRQYQDEQEAVSKTAAAEYKASRLAWEAKTNGLLAKINSSTRTGKDPAELEQSLKLLQATNHARHGCRGCCSATRPRRTSVTCSRNAIHRGRSSSAKPG